MGERPQGGVGVHLLWARLHSFMLTVPKPPDTLKAQVCSRIYGYLMRQVFLRHLEEVAEAQGVFNWPSAGNWRVMPVGFGFGVQGLWPPLTLHNASLC